MCGIFGWAFVGTRVVRRIPWISRVQCSTMANVLAIRNNERGDDSWGVYGYARNHRPYVERHVGSILRTLDPGRLGSRPLVMAHTRAATQGAVSMQNAHPFQVGKILLAHNGVITNHLELNAQYGRSCEVDSEHLAHHLSEGLPFDDIHGYGSIEWVHSDRPDEVNLCRMQQGSLAIYGIRNANGKQVGSAWSSDRDHLEDALDAARLDAFPYALLEEGHVYTVRHGRLYKTERTLQLGEAWATWGVDRSEWNWNDSTQTLTKKGDPTCEEEEEWQDRLDQIEKEEVEQARTAKYDSLVQKWMAEHPLKESSDEAK